MMQKHLGETLRISFAGQIINSKDAKELVWYRISTKRKASKVQLVIFVGIFLELTEQYPDVQLWVVFGTGKTFRHYHINSVCRELSSPNFVCLHRIRHNLSVPWPCQKVILGGMDDTPICY